MTHITIFQNRENQYLGFACRGHAGYADRGEDVVCAGISALTINTVNAIEQYTDERIRLQTQEDDGELSLRFERPAGHDAELLMKSLVLGLQGIQQDYGDEFLRLDFKEV